MRALVNMLLLISTLSQVDAYFTTEVSAEMDIKKFFNNFIAEKRLIVNEKIAQLKEVLSNQNLKVINVLNEALQCTNDDALLESLNEKINYVAEYDNKVVQELGEQTIINLENVASEAKKTCVLKVWEEYINDVLQVFAKTIAYVPECYDKHKVLSTALEIQEKISDTDDDLSGDLAILQLAFDFATNDIEDHFGKELQSAQYERLFHMSAEDC